MLDIPYIQGPGGQCGQTNMLMALKYYYPDKAFTFDQINKLMKRYVEGQWTFPSQIAVVLRELGLNAKSFSSKDIPTEYDEMVKSFKKSFGEDYNDIIKHINLDVTLYFHKKAKEEKAFVVRSHSLKDLEGYLNNGYIVIPCVNSRTLREEKGSFIGHFVTIVDMDNENVWINDPGKLYGGPKKKHTREIFNKAYTSKAIDDDVIVIFGLLDPETSSG